MCTGGRWGCDRGGAGLRFAPSLRSGQALGRHGPLRGPRDDDEGRGYRRPRPTIWVGLTKRRVISSQIMVAQV